MDIVAYSTLHMDRQHQVLHELQEAIRNTSEFARAQAEDQLIRLPTGDGMALVFFHDPEAPVRCALEMAKVLRNHPDIKLRMGIHTGPVYRVADINANRNVAGGGINIAQRVMDCGDAGHILVSSTHAEVLGQVSSWCPMLHDLGEVEVKHGARIHLYNLYTDSVGNPELPRKVNALKGVPRPAAKRLAKGNKLPSVVTAGLTALALACVGGWLFHSRKANALSPTDTLVLADFTNKTGEPIFGDTIRQGLAVQLKQSPFLIVVSWPRIQETLSAAGQPSDSVLTADLATTLCQRIGSKAYISGSIDALSGSYILSVRVVNCRTGKTIAAQRIPVAAKEDVLKAISQASSKIREDLGESLDSIRRFDMPLDVLTPSLEAFQAYASGLSTLDGRQQYPEVEAEWKEEQPFDRSLSELRTAIYSRAAAPLFQQAIRWDMNFSAAYSLLAKCYWNMEMSARAAENTRKAHDLHDRVGDRERFAIDGEYYLLLEEDAQPNVERARQVYEDWTRTYPRDGEPHRALAKIYFNIGQYEKSLQEFREGDRLEPGSMESYSYTIPLYLYLNRLSEARIQLEEGGAKGLYPLALHLFSYRLAFLQNDSAGMAHQLEWAVGKPEAENVMFRADADSAAYFGKLGKARELSRHAMQSAKQIPWASGAWRAVGEEALRDALVGNIEQTRRLGAAFDDYESNSRTTVALALAFAGEMTRPQKFAEERERQVAPYRYRDPWLPLIRAQLWLNRKQPDKAIKILKSARPHDLIGDLLDLSSVYSIYIRGYSNLDAPHFDEAEADFQDILNRRGVVGNSLVGALARVGLARARAFQGDKRGAKSAYQDFFTLWKDADPDIPILKQAKAEYAKLQ
jgi:eukaryotic-like serine/threonine-protein kinase